LGRWPLSTLNLWLYLRGTVSACLITIDPFTWDSSPPGPFDNEFFSCGDVRPIKDAEALTDYFEPNYMGGSDYSGGSVESQETTVVRFRPLRPLAGFVGHP
jgi:hypothetical protein